MRFNAIKGEAIADRGAKDHNMPHQRCSRCDRYRYRNKLTAENDLLFRSD